MGDQRVDHTAFKRISKFNDDKTEQVWELFREEFARASVAEDGETSWRCAAGIMSVDDINKQITGDTVFSHAVEATVEGTVDDRVGFVRALTVQPTRGR